MLYFCEQCEKLVPDSEVKDFNANSIDALRKLNPHAADFREEQEKHFKWESHRVHVYTHTVNAYKNQRPDTIGYCAQKETVWCGKVREPTDYEYFIHHTCKTYA